LGLHIFRYNAYSLREVLPVGEEREMLRLPGFPNQVYLALIGRFRVSRSGENKVFLAYVRDPSANKVAPAVTRMTWSLEYCGAGRGPAEPEGLARVRRNFTTLEKACWHIRLSLCTSLCFNADLSFTCSLSREGLRHEFRSGLANWHPTSPPPTPFLP